MKLLFDQNLSPFLASRLADIFPESAHVLDVGLDRADDAAVWLQSLACGGFPDVARMQAHRAGIRVGLRERRRSRIALRFIRARLAIDQRYI